MNNREAIRWSSTGQDAQLLQQLLESGTIPKGMAAARVQQLYPPFAQYPNPPFAQNLRRMRKTLGLLPPSRSEAASNPTIPPPQMYHQHPANTMMNHNQRQVMQQPPGNTPSPVLHRTTSAQNASRPHANNPNNLVVNLNNLSVSADDDITVNTTATTGGLLSLSSPAATTERIRHVFASAPTTLGHHFWGYQWVDSQGSSRVSLEVTMSSIPVAYYSFSIVQNGWVVLLSCRLPSILTDTIQRNQALYRRPNGDPIYGPDHMRTISQQAAVRALTDTSAFNGTDVILTQEIRLPFAVADEFQETDGRAGVTRKRFSTGLVVVVLEVIDREYRTNLRRNNRATAAPRAPVMIDDVSYAGQMTTIPINYQHGAGESVMSLDQRGTPIARPGRGIPREVVATSVASVRSNVVSSRGSRGLGVASMQGITEGNETSNVVTTPNTSRKRQSTGSSVTTDSHFAVPPSSGYQALSPPDASTPNSNGYQAPNALTSNGYQAFSDRFLGPDHDPLL